MRVCAYVDGRYLGRPNASAYETQRPTPEGMGPELILLNEMSK
jgi:hypothetical protein